MLDYNPEPGEFKQRFCSAYITTLLIIDLARAHREVESVTMARVLRPLRIYGGMSFRELRKRAEIEYSSATAKRDRFGFRLSRILEVYAEEVKNLLEKIDPLKGFISLVIIFVAGIYGTVAWIRNSAQNAAGCSSVTFALHV